MGKPVVAVSTPEIDKYSDVVRIGRSKEEFLRHLDEALALPPTPAEVETFTSRVESESWDARMHSVMDVITHHLEHVGLNGRCAGEKYGHS
jgi:hypothetical protein